MAYVNSHVLTLGVGGKDPVVREAGGTKVLSFSGANTSPFGDKVTTWYNVEFWGKQAETLLAMISKGTQLIGVGETINDPWTDRDGNKRYTLKFRASSLQLISPKGERGEVVEADEVAADDDDIF